MEKDKNEFKISSFWLVYCSWFKGKNVVTLQSSGLRRIMNEAD